SRSRARPGDRARRDASLRGGAARRERAFARGRSGYAGTVPEARGGAVRIGCSGWNYKHWREIFYPKGLPPGRWLERYAQVFDTVEINNTFYRLLRAHAAALVIRDDPRRPCQTLELTADWTFLRFHSGSDGGNYTEEELERWARRIEDWRERVDVYAYFNNDWEGFAIQNAAWLK